MMKAQFKEVNGLQDPILGQSLNFSIMRDKPFVQVLHDGKMHWLTIVTYKCKEGEINILDSRLYSMALAYRIIGTKLCPINVHFKEIKLKKSFITLFNRQ